MTESEINKRIAEILYKRLSQVDWNQSYPGMFVFTRDDLIELNKLIQNLRSNNV